MNTSSRAPTFPLPDSTPNAAPDAAAETPRRAFLRGLRDILPLLPGVLPFGIVYGIAARAAHVPAWLTQAMSALVFAGSSQFAVVTLVAGGVPVLLLVLTAAVLNLRHILYSASLAPTLRDAPRGWRLLLAYLLTDEMYGVIIGKLAHMPPARRRWYAFGAGLTLWVCWQISTLIGLLAGGEIPASWSLDFAATLTFIALVVPMLADRPHIAAALASAVVSILALSLPLKLGIVVAALAGVAAGVLVDTLLTRRSSTTATTAPETAPDKERP